MQEIQILTQKAINFFKEKDWLEAIKVNKEILKINANDLNALNRLAIALIKNGNTTNGRKTFKQILILDPYNKIAKKNLNALKNLINEDLNKSAKNFCIEESTQSKIIILYRLAGKNILKKNKIGQNLTIKIKNHFITLENQEGNYIGALPEDVSYRLTKLIENGNKYNCQIYFISESECKVYLKEIFKSRKNRNHLSFPILKKEKNNKETDETDFLENAVNYNLDEDNIDKVEMNEDFD